MEVYEELREARLRLSDKIFQQWIDLAMKTPEGSTTIVASDGRWEHRVTFLEFARKREIPFKDNMFRLEGDRKILLFDRGHSTYQMRGLNAKCLIFQQDKYQSIHRIFTNLLPLATIKGVILVVYEKDKLMYQCG
jgi:hypothetical protein